MHSLIEKLCWSLLALVIVALGLLVLWKITVVMTGGC